jgi:hypothetical protein
MKKLSTAVRGLIKGIGKGGASTAEVTLIPTIIREIGKLRKAKDVYRYGGKFDLNGDGKINFKDLQELTWETIGKMIGLILAPYLALRFGVIDHFIALLHMVVPDGM